MLALLLTTAQAAPLQVTVRHFGLVMDFGLQPGETIEEWVRSVPPPDARPRKARRSRDIRVALTASAVDDNGQVAVTCEVERRTRRGGVEYVVKPTLLVTREELRGHFTSGYEIPLPVSRGAGVVVYEHVYRPDVEIDVRPAE